MSKQEEAGLILELYKLRREDTMRKARDWFWLFNPQSLEDFNNTMFANKEQSGYMRMVYSYWDMAAALVNHGAISVELFNDTNSEHIAVFSKMEPILGELRAASGPGFLANLEKLIDATPDGRKRAAAMREAMKTILPRIAASQAAEAAKV